TGFSQQSALSLRKKLDALERPTSALASAPRDPANRDDEIAGVRLSNPGRILWPDLGITKLELARYHEAMAPWMLPHVDGRPLTLVRCPEGIGGGCFFMKHSRG